jgi:hypothetical protein
MTKVKAQISNECQIINAKKYVPLIHSNLAYTGEGAQSE